MTQRHDTPSRRPTRVCRTAASTMIAPVASNCIAALTLFSCRMFASAPSMTAAGDGADHAAGAAEQAGAADHHGGDGGQLVAGAVVRAAEAELAGMDDAGAGGGEAGDRVDRYLDPRSTGMPDSRAARSLPPTAKT